MRAPSTRALLAACIPQPRPERNLSRNSNMSVNESRNVPVEKLAKPLVEAAAAGNAEVFKSLVEVGADVKALVKAGADAGADDNKEYKRCTLLHTAIRGGSVDVVSVVLDAGADANERGDSSSDRSPLCEALSTTRPGNEEVAKRLVLAGADVNPSGKCSPLSLAISKGYERLAEDLLQKGANPNLDDETKGRPLACAASRGLSGITSNLLRHGADKDKVDGSGNSPLILASKEGYLSTVEVLLEAGADVNIIGGDASVHGGDASALGVAGEFGHSGVIEALVAAGAEVNALFSDGSTALHRAAANSEPDAVDALIKAGAKTEIKDVDGDEMTPLLVAASQEVFQTMLALLKGGADPDAKDSGGNTALHTICLSPKVGFEEVVDELLRRGADKTIRDWDGCTPAGNLDVPRDF